MKQSDLRIGNFILVGNFVKVITGIHNDTIFCKTKMDAPQEEDEHHISEINPIVISEQWLLDFGFIKTYNSYNEFYLPSTYVGRFISLELKTGYVFVSDLNLCHWSDDNSHIKYVHQLQNLHFTITGIELI
jgi:hypothetical protein